MRLICNRTQNDAIWELIALFLTNQIAGNTIDFKMNVIRLEIRFACFKISISISWLILRLFSSGKLKITLIDAEHSTSKVKNKSIGHKRPTKRLRDDGTEESVNAHSQIFILGYR